MFKFEYREDVIMGRSYEHLQDRLSRTEAMKVVRHATNSQASLRYIKELIEYNLGQGPYRPEAIGALIRGWWLAAMSERE